MRAGRTTAARIHDDEADICVGNYCEYFHLTSVGGDGGYGWPTCNASTNAVGFLELNIDGGVEYAFRRWFVYWNGQRWVSEPAQVQGVDEPGGAYTIGDTFGVSGFTSFHYPQWTANESRFMIWYEGWLMGQNGQWLGPTWVRPGAFVLTGPYFGAGWTSNYSTVCITEDPPENIITVG